MGDVVSISHALRAEREAVLTTLLEAHNRGDIDAAVAAFHAPRLESVPSGRVITTAADMAAYLRERRHGFPDQSFEIIDLHHADSSVIAELWMSGTHTGEVNNIAPSGKRMHVRMAAVFAFDGADLIGQRVYYDAGTVARQLA